MLFRSVVGPGWQVESVDDYDGDRRDDLLWRHSPTGTVAMWLMDGARATRTAVVGGDRTWRPVATSGHYDADGDGRADLLWRNGVTGATRLWIMDGTTRRTVTDIGGDTRWEIAATGDFDRDGRGDLVWRDRVSGTSVAWLMNGASAVSSRILLPAAGASPASGWSIVATIGAGSGGRAAIVVRERAGGRSTAWWMDGTTVMATSSIGADGRLEVMRRPGRLVG